MDDLHVFSSALKLWVGFMISLTVFTLISPQSSAAEPSPLEQIASIPLKGKPGTLDHLYVDDGSARLFLANQSNDSLDIVDVKNNQLIRQIPGQGTIHSVAFAHELDRLFISNGEGTCNVFDATSYALIKSIPVLGADSVRFDPRTNHVFVAGRNSLTVIDAKTMEPI